MNQDLFTKAVQTLHKELSPNLILQLQSSNLDRIDHHLSLGVMVRNVLRRSDVEFDDVWLDDQWFEILQEAMKRHEQPTSNS